MLGTLKRAADAHNVGHTLRVVTLGVGAYHRWATRQQIKTCYPQFPEFLRMKRKYDPAERFQSNWYRHYKEMFAEVL